MPESNLNLTRQKIGRRYAQRDIHAPAALPSAPPLMIFSYGTWEKSNDPDNTRMIEVFAKNCSLPTENKFILEDIDLLGTNVNTKVKAILDDIKNEMLRKIEHNEPLPEKICGLGFSRGSVALNRIAYEFDNSFLPKIIAERDRSTDENIRKKLTSLIDALDKMRFFLFENDPVAGPGHKKDKGATVISKRVEECIVTYQTHENRWIMKGQGPSRTWLESPSQTALTYLPLPGNHADSTVMTINGEKKTTSALINWALAYQCFSKHGILFENNTTPNLAVKFINKKRNSKIKTLMDLSDNFASFQDPAIFLEYYSILRNDPNEKDMSAKRFGNDHPEDFVLDADFFYNQHERELFKKAHPEIFNYLFENNSNQLKSEDLQPKFEYLCAHYGLTFLRIIKQRSHLLTDDQAKNLPSTKTFLFLKHNGKTYMFSPGGKNQIEDFRLSEAKPAGRTPLYLLERLVVDSTNQYKRQRSELKKNSDHRIAVTMRENLRDIMNKKAEDVDKVNQIIVLLKNTQATLIIKNKENKLAQKIDEILIHYFHEVNGVTQLLFRLPEQLNQLAKHEHKIFKLLTHAKKPEIASSLQLFAIFLQTHVNEMPKFAMPLETIQQKKSQLPSAVKQQARVDLQESSVLINKFYKNINQVYNYFYKEIEKIISAQNKIQQNIQAILKSSTKDLIKLEELEAKLLSTKTQLDNLFTSLQTINNCQIATTKIPSATQENSIKLAHSVDNVIKQSVGTLQAVTSFKEKTVTSEHKKNHALQPMKDKNSLEAFIHKHIRHKH